MSDLERYKTPEFLRKQLVVLGKSKKQLADELGVDQTTINRWTKHLDLGINFHRRALKGRKKAPMSEEQKELIRQAVKQQYANGRRPTNFKGRETCPVCSSTFEIISNSNTRKGGRKVTCSRRCGDKLHSQRIKNKPRKVSMVKKACEECGKSFSVHPSNGHLRFCSYACSSSFRASKTYEQLYGEEKASIIKQKLAEARAHISKSMTKPVRILVDQLAPVLGIPEIEYRIGQYWVDLCYPEDRVVIEVGGNYWHNYPIGLPRDKIKTGYLVKLGWMVFRKWESEILAHPYEATQDIVREIENGRTQQ